MLENRLVEECWGEVLEKSVGEKCCGEVFAETSVVEKCRREVL